jgi:hypothetical protein
MHGEMRNYEKFYSLRLNERYNLKDLGRDGRIILK